MMREAILNFPKQFLFNPQIEKIDKFKKINSFIIVGIGGSRLAADLVKTVKPELDLTIHCDYGLPKVAEEKLKDSLIILVSYSGNTEEVVEAFNQAQRKKINSLVISTGGRLQDLAQEYHVPRIKIPNTGIQPRMAIGFSFRAILKVLGENKLLQETQLLARSLMPLVLKTEGKKLAKKLIDYVPIIYSSTRNHALAYNWKIKFNETAKIPAFCNVLPEMNHNEMTGFDVKTATRNLSRIFYFLLLIDEDDSDKILTRMEVLQKSFEERKLKVEAIKIKCRTRLEKIFSFILLADWTALYLAEYYGSEAEEVPMVEKFKKLIR